MRRAVALGTLGLAIAALAAGCPRFEEGASGRPGKPQDGEAAKPPLYIEATELAARQDVRCEDCHFDTAVNTYELPHIEVGVGCSGCHGPSVKHTEVEDNSVKPDRTWRNDRHGVPGLCAHCHRNAERMQVYGLGAGQLAALDRSPHGPGGDGKHYVAACTDCHGGFEESPAMNDREIWDHKVHKPSDPRSSVYPARVIHTCSRCHADPDLMKKFDLPSDGLKDYLGSVHADRLLKENDVERGPSCAGCHGSHHVRTWPEVETRCADCHAGMEFHYPDYAKPADAQVRCTPCHGHHEIFTRDARRMPE